MSVTAGFVLHGIASASPSFFLSQLTNVRASPGINVLKGIPSGLPGSRFNYNITQNLDTTADSTQIKSILDACGTGLVSLASGNTDYLYKATVNRASRLADATASHLRLRAAAAVMIPLQLNAADGSPASISCRFVNTYNGSAEPLVPSAAALSGTPSHAENYTVGPCSLNGTAINGVQSIAINFGVAVVEKRGDGELYISWLFEKESLPTITITTLSAPWVAMGISGTALTSMSVYLRKCNQVARAADSDAEHILFSATSGLFHISETGGGGNEPVMTTITAELSMPDATTRALLVDTTAAIS